MNTRYVCIFIFMLFYRCKLPTRRSKSARATTTHDLNTDLAHGQTAGCPARPTRIDDGLEDISWIHGLGGGSLPVVSYGIFPEFLFFFVFAVQDGWRIFVFCVVVYTSGQLFFFFQYAYSVPAI